MIKFFLFLVSFSCFSHLQALSSFEAAEYPFFCSHAVQNHKRFSSFKKHPAFTEFYENISHQEGMECLKIISRDYPHLERSLDRFKEIDQVGGPRTAKFGLHGRFSPATIHGVKIAGDLFYEFGDLSGKHIVEIGGGGGGLCKTLFLLFDIESYTIIDLPSCNALTKKALESLGIFNVNFVDVYSINEAIPSDLVISRFAFSSFDRSSQNHLFEFVLKAANSGFLLSHQNSFKYGIDSFAFHEIAKQLYQAGKKGSVKKLRGASDPTHGVIAWKPSSVAFSRKIAASTKNISGITYGFSGGRFGDNLLSYFHARWLCYKYSLPLIYRPFPYSEKLMLSMLDNQMKTGEKPCELKEENDLLTPFHHPCLLSVPYFPESLFEYKDFKDHLYFKVDWEDPDFKEIIKYCLQPLDETSTLDIPNDKISIALHVRKGGNVDDPNGRKFWPLKMPVDQWYIEQLKRVASFFPGEKLWVYLFTDDLDPESLAFLYGQAVNEPNMTFSCRKLENNPQSNVLEDFYSMSKFRCFIHPESNLSIMAEKLGNYDIVLTPSSAAKQGGGYAIDFTEISFNGEK